jgi:hypothetical protein
MRGCGVDYLAHDKNQWHELVNMVMNLRVLQGKGKVVPVL